MEIDPQKIVANYPVAEYTPCGPWYVSTDFYNPYQVIWNGSILFIDPYQQLFNYQANYFSNYALLPDVYYDIEITEGEEYCWIQKAGYTDPETGVFIEPQIIGSVLTNILGEDLIGTGEWAGNENCRNEQKQFPSFYTLHFARDIPPGTEIIMKRSYQGGDDIFFHSIVETPILNLNNLTDTDTLPHLYSRPIDIYAQLPATYYQGNPGCYRCGGKFPSDISFNLEITNGQEYGQLYDTETQTGGLDFTDIYTENGAGFIFGQRYKYIADGTQPDENQPGIVTIQCIPSDPEINTVEFSFPVRHNENPPDQLLVEFSNPTISPGDTTRVIVKKILPYGYEEFYPDQLFDVEIIEGAEYGVVLDSLSGDTLSAFTQIPQGFKIIAKDSIGVESAKIKIKVTTVEGGLPPVASPVKRKNNYKGLNKISEKSGKIRGDSVEPNFIIIPEPTTLVGYGEVVVEGDECNEEIVDCNNWIPPIFEDVGVTTTLQENEHWEWIDDEGNSQIASTGSACNFDVLLVNQPLDFGKTYIMPYIGNYALPIEKIYGLLEDMKVIACLENSSIPNETKWHFSVENMRVPIFRDICTEEPGNLGYVNLGNGSSPNLLAANIKNCNDFTNVMVTLKWWKKGPYRQINQNPPYKYYFYSGIFAHESVHIKQIRDGGTKYFPISSIKQKMADKMGLGGLSNYDSPKSVYKCPEDALNAIIGHPGFLIKKKDLIKDNLRYQVFDASKLSIIGDVNEQGIPNSELEADELARPEYDAIEQNILNWARQQSWWCNFLSDIGYQGCNGDFCP